MARSSDPRRPTPFQRGSKRYHSVGGHVPPGDEVENTRDHERIWFELRRHRSCCCEPDTAGFRYCLGPVADYATMICGEHLIPSNSLIDYYPGDGYNGGGLGYWALFNGCGAGEADSEPLGAAIFYPDGSWRNGPVFTGQSKPLDFVGTSVGWNAGFWLPNVTWSFEFWMKPSSTDIALGSQLTASGPFMGSNDGGIFTNLRTGGGISFFHETVGTVESSSGIITADDWHHIVYVRDATAESFSIYVNGVRRVYRTLVNDFPINGDILFAPFSGSSNSQFSDVARYNVALTPLQIFRHYRAMADRYALNPPDGEEPGGDGGGGVVVDDPADFIFDLDPSRIAGGDLGDVMMSNGDTAYWESPERSPFELEERKGVADGYASLDSTAKVPTTELATGIAAKETFFRGDRVWAEGQIVPPPNEFDQILVGGPNTSADYLAQLAASGLSLDEHFPLTEAAAPYASLYEGDDYAAIGTPTPDSSFPPLFSGETCLKFDSGDGLSRAQVWTLDTNNHSWMAWVWIDEIPASDVLLFRHGSAADGLDWLLTSAGTIKFHRDDGPFTNTGSIVLETGRWYYLAGVYDSSGAGTQLALWVDGVVDFSVPAGGFSFNIGSGAQIAGDGFVGRIGHFTVTDSQLVQADVDALFAQRYPTWVPTEDTPGGVEASEDDVPVTAAPRSRVNFKAGTNVTVDVVDDAAGDEVEVTISATAPAGSGIEVSDNGVDVSVAPRGRVNFLDGFGTTANAVDDAVNDEVEITIDLPDATGAAVGDVLALDGSSLPAWVTPGAGGIEASLDGVDVTAAARSRVNFIQGAGVELTVADDAVGDEVDVTVALAAASDVGASVKSTAGQTVTDSTLTAVAWEAEDRDDGGFHDNVTNNTRLTAPEDGWYAISGYIRFTSGGTDGKRGGLIAKNGDLTNGRLALDFRPAVPNSSVVVTTLAYLTAGDYVEFYAYQDNSLAASDTLLSTAPNIPRFSIALVGRAMGGGAGGGGGGGMEASLNGSDVTAAPRSRFNFVDGTGVSLGVSDDAANDKVDVTVTTSFWQEALNLPLDSLTGWTSDNGTWAVSVDKFVASAGQDARLRYDTEIAQACCIVECDIQFDGSGEAYGGIALGWDGVGTGGTQVRISRGGAAGTGLVAAGAIGAAPTVSESFTINASTWYRLRVLKAGTSYSVFVDGTLIFTAAVSDNAGPLKIGLIHWHVATNAWFRNLKAYTLALP